MPAMNHTRLTETARSHATPPQTQRGLTLVELLIATVISAVLLGGVLAVYVDSKNAYALTLAKSELQSDARATFRIVSRLVAQAGYRNLRDIRKSDETIFRANATFAAGQVIRAAAVGAAGGWLLETRFQGDSDGLVADCLGFSHHSDLVVTQTVKFDPTTQTLSCAVQCSSDRPGAVLCAKQEATLSEQLHTLELLVGLDTGNDNVIDRYQRITSLNGSERNLLAIKALGWFESEQNLRKIAEAQVLKSFNGDITETDQKLRLAFSDTFSVRSRLP